MWVSHDRALTWEHLNNYPIGQFYNVDVDMQQPYHIYGGMQDNASWGGPSSVRDRQGIANEHWYQMLSCDGMFTVVDPTDGNASTPTARTAASSATTARPASGRYHAAGRSGPAAAALELDRTDHRVAAR